MCSLGMPRMSQHSNVWQACHVLGLYDAWRHQWAVIACYPYQFYNTLASDCRVTCECLVSSCQSYIRVISLPWGLIATFARQQLSYELEQKFQMSSKSHQIIINRATLHKIASLTSTFQTFLRCPNAAKYPSRYACKHQSPFQYLPIHATMRLASILKPTLATF